MQILCRSYNDSFSCIMLELKPGQLLFMGKHVGDARVNPHSYGVATCKLGVSIDLAEYIVADGAS